MSKKNLFIFVMFIYFSCINNVYAGRGCCSWHGGQNYCGSDGYWYCNDGTRSPSCTCSGGNSNSSTYSYQKKEVYGCTDINAFNYNSSATVNDGSCIKKIYGCMDKNAYNYNASANISDNSCIAKVYGCIDDKAYNYDNKANIGDGSCLYKKTKTKIKKIKYKTKKKFSLFKKSGNVIKKGRNGKKKITYKVVYNEKNEVVSKKKINEEILIYSVTEFVVK